MIDYSDMELLDELRRRGLFYGDGGTIHRTGVLDVEVDAGQVVSVWFRCKMLPFKQHDASDGNVGRGNPEEFIRGIVSEPVAR